MYFVKILHASFYNKLIGNATKNFTNMAMSKEMIENAFKIGKLGKGKTLDAERKKVPSDDRKEVQALIHNG